MAQQQAKKGDKAGKKLTKRRKRPEYLTAECKASRLLSQATTARAKIRYLTRRAESGRPVTEGSVRSVYRDDAVIRERIARPIVGERLKRRIMRLENHARRSEKMSKELGGTRIA